MISEKTTAPMLTSGDSGTPPGGEEIAVVPLARSSWRHRTLVTSVQASLVLAFLAGWQWLPTIPHISQHISFLDPFFISSPSRVAAEVADVMTGGNNQILIWPYLERTLLSTLLGTGIGVLAGVLAGLVLSNSRMANEVARPFLVGFNAVPRIAIIPVLVLVFGISESTSVVSVILVVFFLAFFNAYEGARSVPTDMVRHARLLGASDWKVIQHLRTPYALAWTLAVMPLMLTFGLITAVTVELLSGVRGVGYLLEQAIEFGEASLTFAVVVILSVVGVLLNAIASLARKRVLHWWPASNYEG